VARGLVPALLATAVLGAAAALLGRAAVGPNPVREADVYRWRGRLLWRFHATFRDEKLFDPRTDPYETRDLSGEMPGETLRMRNSFLKRLRLHSLGEVPVSEEEWKGMVEGNGYFGATGEGR